MPGQVTARGKGATPARKTPSKAARKAAGQKAAETRKRNAEAKLAEAAQEEEAPEPKHFIRNAWNSEVRLTLTPFNSDRGIRLKPLGERGDMARVSKQELEDDNLDWNLVNYVDEETARAIMAQQSVNQQAPHAALAVLRNELDQPYAQPPQVMAPYEQQGTVVAQFGQGAGTPHLEHTEQMQRAEGQPPAPPYQPYQQPAPQPAPNQPVIYPVGPQQVTVPGSQGYPQPPVAPQQPQGYPPQQQVPQGFAALPPGVQPPAGMPPERIADWVARGMPSVNPAQTPRPVSDARQAQAAQALRDSLHVSVNPPQPGFNG